MIPVMLELLVLVGVIFLIVILYIWSRREREKRLRHELDTHHTDIIAAEQAFLDQFNSDRYFSKQTWLNWLSQWNRLQSIVTRAQHLQLRDEAFQKTLVNLSNLFTNGLGVIEKRNSAFIEEECQAFQKLFDTLEQYPLTYSQRRSVIVDEHNNLIVAGAGTGKTSS